MATCLPYKLAWLPIISIYKEKGKTTSPTVCLTITSDTVADIKRLLGKQPKTYHNNIIMIWQLAVLHSFFLCSSEFTVPSPHQYDPNIHPSLVDITVDNRHALEVVQLYIKKSKTTPF